MNSYGYVANNAIMHVDLLGLFKYEFEERHGIAQSGGKIGGTDYGLVEPLPSILKVKGNLFRCHCCIKEIEFLFKQVKYLPVVGDILTSWRDVPQPGDTIVREPYEVQVTEDILKKLTLHENAHVWANKTIAFAIFRKGEDECRSKCWWLPLGASTQQDCDSLVKAKAQEVVDYFSACRVGAGVHLHAIIGMGLEVPMPTRDQLYQYIRDIRASIDVWKKDKTFCSGGK